MAEKNIAALLREDTRTVQVSFGAGRLADDMDELERDARGDAPLKTTRSYAKAPDQKFYTYVTNLALTVGDTVVVEAGDTLKLAAVRRVDDNVAIEPNDPTKYRWVVQKVDFTEHLANEARNAEIDTAVAEAYKANLRKSFAQQILSGLPDAQRDKVSALLGGPK